MKNSFCNETSSHFTIVYLSSVWICISNFKWGKSEGNYWKIGKTKVSFPFRNESNLNNFHVLDFEILLKNYVLEIALALKLKNAHGLMIPLGKTCQNQITWSKNSYSLSDQRNVKTMEVKREVFSVVIFLQKVIQ